VIIVTGTNAFKNASLIMFQKIANILSIASFVLITSTLGASYMGYRYIKSPEFERTIKNKLMGDLQKKLPDVMKNTLPETTGESFALPTPLRK
tara:strand:- start:177 stop:455 length:279 start_codon:yes stop_codon:yes gene_type:complete